MWLPEHSPQPSTDKVDQFASSDDLLVKQVQTAEEVVIQLRPFQGLPYLHHRDTTRPDTHVRAYVHMYMRVETHLKGDTVPQMVGQGSKIKWLP